MIYLSSKERERNREKNKEIERERETEREKKSIKTKSQSLPQIPLHHAHTNLHRAWQTDRQMEEIDKHSLMTDRQIDNLFTGRVLVKKLHRP